jgi:hypothetical protein
MEDYMNLVLHMEPFRCRFCGLALVVDKISDRVIAAPEKRESTSL